MSTVVDLHKVNGVTILEVDAVDEARTLRRQVALLIKVNDQYGVLCDSLISHNGSLIARNAYYRGRALRFAAVGLVVGSLATALVTYDLAQVADRLLRAVGL